jgi:hypothetical protein
VTHFFRAHSHSWTSSPRAAAPDRPFRQFPQDQNEATGIPAIPAIIPASAIGPASSITNSLLSQRTQRTHRSPLPPAISHFPNSVKRLPPAAHQICRFEPTAKSPITPSLSITNHRLPLASTLRNEPTEAVVGLFVRGPSIPPHTHPFRPAKNPCIKNAQTPASLKPLHTPRASISALFTIYSPRTGFALCQSERGDSAQAATKRTPALTRRPRCLKHRPFAGKFALRIPIRSADGFASGGERLVIFRL